MGTIADAAGFAQLQPSGPDMATPEQTISDVNQNLNDLGQSEANQKSLQAAFKTIKFTTDSQGNQHVMVEMPSQTFDYLGNLIQTGKSAQEAFAQARAQLAAKRQFLQENPVIAGIGRIASTAAAQYGSGYGPRLGRDISPVVRAAGAYGLDVFGQTPDALAQQEAGLASQEFAVANQLDARAARDAAIKQQADYQNKSLGLQALSLQASIADRQARAEEKKTADLRSYTKDVVSNAVTNRGLSDPEAQAIRDSAGSFGLTPPQAEDLISRAKSAALQAQVRHENDVREGLAKTYAAAEARDRSTAKRIALQTEANLTLRDRTFEQQLERDIKKAALQASASGEKVSDKARGAMVQMAVVEKNIKDVRDLIAQHPEAFGPVGGTVTKVTSLIDPTASGVAASAQHLFAQLAKGYGGARGFSKVEQPVFKDLAGSVFNSPEALAEKLDKIQNWVDANRSAWIQLEPGLARVMGQSGSVAPAPPGTKPDKVLEIGPDGQLRIKQ